MSHVSTKDLDKAKKWCEKARELLQTKKFFGNKTELSIEAQQTLEKFMKNIKLLKDKKDLQDRYDTIAADFLELSKLGKSSKDSNDQSLALTLTAHLEHLNNRVDYALGKINNVALDESRKKLANGVAEQYKAELQNAKSRQLDLQSKKQGMYSFDGAVTKLITDAELVAAEKTGNSVRETSLTKAITILKDVEKEYAAAVELHTDYVRYIAKYNEANLISTQLRQINVSFSAEVDKVLFEAASLAKGRKFADAMIKLDKPLKTAYEKSIKTHNISKPQLDYIAKMAEAESRERELIARSNSEVNYADTISKNIALAKQKAKGPPPDFVAAVNALGDTKSVYDTQIKLADKAEKKKLEAARHKPVYDDKVNRIRNAISELKALPGTKNAVTLLQGLLNAGSEKLKTTEDYEQAYKALAGLTAAYQQGLTAAKNFSSTVGNELYRTNLAEAKLQLQRLDGLVGRSQFQLIAEKQKAIDDSVMRISNGESVDAETLTIGTLAVNLKKLADDVVPQRDTCVNKKINASEMIKTFQERFLIGEYDVLPLFRSAESEFGVDNYLVATGLYENVITKLLDIEKDQKNNDSFNKWEIAYAELKSSGALASLAKVRSESCKSIVKFASLESQTSGFLQNLSQTRDYKTGLDLAEKVKAAATEIEEILKKYHETDVRRGELFKLANAEIAAANLKIAELKKKEGDVDPFNNALNKLQSGWNTSLNSSMFLTVKEFDDAFEEFKTQVAAQIVTPITNMLAEPGGLPLLNDSKKAAKSKSTAKGLKQELLAVSAKLNEMKKDASAYEFLGPLVALPTFAHPVIETATTELDRIQSEISKDPITDSVGLEGAIKTLGGNLTTVIANLERERKKLSQTAKQALQNCLNSLNSLKSSHKSFEPYFKSLTERVNDLTSMADSLICSTVEQCVDTANELASKEIGPLTSAFTAIDEILNNIKINMNDSDLKTHMPERFKILNFRFEKEVKLDLYKKGPVLGKAAVEEFLKEVRVAVQNAKDALRIKEEIKRLVGECKSKLELMADAPHLQSSYEGIISSASTPLEGGEASALQRLRATLGQIEKLLGPEAAGVRLEMEKNTREQEINAKLRLEQYKSACDVLDKNQIRQAAERKDGMDSDQVNKDLYKQIAELREEADKMLKKGLVDTAFEKLDAARAAALQFLNNPFSIQVTARQNLSKVGVRWTQTVNTFVKSMNALQMAVMNSMNEENKTAPGTFQNVQEVMKPLSEAARSFEATKFDNYIRTIVSELGKEKIDLAAVKAYRAAKEDALRFVRTYQTVVEKDPVLQSAASNPFGVDVSVRSVGDALRDLEVNFRRA